MQSARQEMRRRLSSNIGWVTLWGFLSRAFPVAAMFVAARILGAHEFGRLAAVLATVTTIEALVTSGLHVTAIRHLAATRSRPEEFGQILGSVLRLAMLATGAASITALLAPEIISTALTGTLSLANEIRLSALWIFLSCCTTVFLGIFLALERPRILFRIGATQGVVAMTLIPLLASYFGVPGSIAGWTAVNFVGVLAYLWLLPGELPSGVTLWRSIRGPSNRSFFWSSVVPGSVNGFAWTAGQWVALAIVLRSDAGPASVGAFAAAQQILSAAVFVPMMVGVAISPILSERLGAGSAVESANLFWKSFFWISVCAMPIGAVVIAGSPWIAEAYGTTFVPLTAVFAIGGATIIVTAPQGVLTQYFFALERNWLLALTGILGGLVNAVAAFFLASRTPDLAAAAALLIAQSVKGGLGLCILAWLRRGRS
ncbi:MAG: oligosaccharide flippase family protein [Burkholderiales bacterium]